MDRQVTLRVQVVVSDPTIHGDDVARMETIAEQRVGEFLRAAKIPSVFVGRVETTNSRPYDMMKEKNSF